MRIIYFYQYFTTPKGAWSTRAYEFARRWVAAGHEVTVVTSVYDKSDLKATGLVSRVNVDGIDVRIINVRLSNKHGFVRRLGTFALFAALATWYALTIAADVVVASSGPITVGLPGQIARFLRRKPLVFEVRDLWPEGAIQLGLLRSPLLRRLARWFERRCYEASSAVIALSPGMGEGIRAAGYKGPVAVVPNAADNALFGAENASAPEMPGSLVVYAGSLGRMDGAHQMVDAARVLAQRGRRDITVEILGDGACRPQLESTARAYGLENVSFLGLRRKTDVVRRLAAAAAALVVFEPVPVLDTSSPNKLFDALAAGVPVIQTTQGWIKELLEEEECGITVRADDPEAMADAIERLVDNPELRARMGRNARRVAEERFDRDMLASKMLGVLEAVAEGREVPVD